MTEDRQKIFDAYIGGKSKSLERMFLAYDRYFEADLILKKLQSFGEDINKLEVVDYGCGPGDYGMHLARAGAFLVAFDCKTMVDFVSYRADLEKIKYVYQYLETGPLHVPALEEKVFEGGKRIAIFGEVLEHLDDPLSTLKEYVDKGVDYIFTSSYPYRSDDPENIYWKKGGHTETARLAQPACRELLLSQYEKIKLTDDRAEINLWKRK